MDYAMVSKLEKARYYAAERERFQFDKFQVTMKGNNHDEHVVTYDNGSVPLDAKEVIAAANEVSREKIGVEVELEFQSKEKINLPGFTEVRCT